MIDRETVDGATTVGGRVAATRESVGHAVTMTTYQGRTVRAIQVYSTNGVSLHPIRRVSGEPCPGMLPTVNAA